MGSQSEVGMRNTHGVGWIADFRLDLVYALRQLCLTPAFAGATILTLALGIGASTTVLSIFRADFRPFYPFEAPDRLVYIQQHERRCVQCDRMTTGNYVTIRDESRTLRSVSLAGGWPYIYRGAERSELLVGTRVSSGFFQTLGLASMLGRTLTTADSESSRNHVVVLSEDTWRSQFAADSNVLGRQMILDGDSYTIVGVVGDAGTYPDRTALWTPLSMDAQRSADRDLLDYIAVARLRDGISFSTARAEMSMLGDRMAAEHPESMKGQTFATVLLTDWIDRSFGDEAHIFIAAVGFVLLIACVNLAGLFLARLIGRRRELAVRSALGASPTRVAGQLVLETVLLSLLGGALGAAVAAVALKLARNNATEEMISSKVGAAHLVDGAMLGTALAMGLLTGLVIGVWPAVRFSRPGIVGELMDAPRGATATRGGASFRQGLTVVQIGFAIVLLTAAILLVRSARESFAVRPGFDAEHVLALRYHDAIGSPRRSGRDPERRDRLVQALEGLPGVTRAAAALKLPYDDEYYSNNLRVVLNGARDTIAVPLQTVTAGYFDVLGIPMVNGRGFNDDDRTGALPVAIINQVLSRRLFRGRNPVGQILVIDRSEWTIVGVSGNVSYGSVSNPVEPEVFRVMRQRPGGVTTGIAVRAQGDPALLAASVRRIVREFDADVAITRMQTMTERQHDALAPIRMRVGMMTFFALAAVLISGIGLYGVVNYGAAQRTREFGVRLALGATQGSILRLVLGEGLRLAAVGAVLGGLGAIALTRLMRSLLFHVSPSDPLTYVLVTLGIGMVALAASYVPARKASLVDPVQALRHD